MKMAFRNGDWGLGNLKFLKYYYLIQIQLN